MIATDEDALTCDFAETYHIIQWRELPVRTQAVLAFGLSEDSRIKMAIRGASVTTDTMMKAMMVDRLSLLWWSKTKDAEHGYNRPQMVTDALINGKQEREFETFRDGAAFDEAFRKITEG